MNPDGHIKGLTEERAIHNFWYREYRALVRDHAREEGITTEEALIDLYVQGCYVAPPPT